MAERLSTHFSPPRPAPGDPRPPQGWAQAIALGVGLGLWWWLGQTPAPLPPVEESAPAPAPPPDWDGALSLALDPPIAQGDNPLEAEVAAPTQPQPQATLPTTQGWHLGSFPVENFVAYTSPFGYRVHPAGGWRFHYGLDLAAPMGSYVRAWWDGHILEVSSDTACGIGVVIESGPWLHIYCHLQGTIVVEVNGDRWLVDREGGLRLRQGDPVRVGQRIGRVGLTGRTTGPHLHWGLKYRGDWVDPALVLRAMAEATAGD